MRAFKSVFLCMFVSSLFSAGCTPEADPTQNVDGAWIFSFRNGAGDYEGMVDTTLNEDGSAAVGDETSLHMVEGTGTDRYAVIRSDVSEVAEFFGLDGDSAECL